MKIWHINWFDGLRDNQIDSLVFSCINEKVSTRLFRRINGDVISSSSIHYISELNQLQNHHHHNSRCKRVESYTGTTFDTLTLSEISETFLILLRQIVASLVWRVRPVLCLILVQSNVQQKGASSLFESCVSCFCNLHSISYRCRRIYFLFWNKELQRLKTAKSLFVSKGGQGQRNEICH